MSRKPRAKAAKPKQRYGIAEWYGDLFRNLGDAERKFRAGVRNWDMPCPFMNQVPTLGPRSGKLCCNKPGGVCSLRNFHEPTGSGGELEFGPITATCPNRFLEAGTIVRHIGRVLLGTEQPLFAKELPFLRRPQNPAAYSAVADTEAEQGPPAAGVEDAGSEDVGRIDLVFVDPNDATNWCAVEMQAVYFSGGAMSDDFKAIKAFTGNGVPLPARARRPDFRSSGPKRLMPQLMIKVPTLRRWGKKMVVVIDEPFFEAMEGMKGVDHVSNCDIVWVVVRFDENQEIGRATLNIAHTLYTTLEAAVTGLTAGRPTTLPEFEKKLSTRLAPALP
jgi:hypothetical protein